MRPHVKAFKSTALARRLADAGHTAFCAATPREIEGMAEAGLGADLLLANETLDTERLGRLRDVASITVAVDSDATLDAAVRGGIRSVLIDVEVGLPRCGCDVDDAGRLADRARAAGLDVRGVMGYEGHLMMVKDRAEKVDRVRGAMEILLRAHDSVGGDIVSGGGTGTWDVNEWCTELQAGSYVLLDTQYAELDSPFEKSLSMLAHGHLRQPQGMDRDRRRPEGARDGPRQPVVGPWRRVLLFRRAHHAAAAANRATGPSATAPGSGRPMSTRPSPVTNSSGWSTVPTATRSSTAGRSTCGTGDGQARSSRIAASSAGRLLGTMWFVSIS